MGEQKYKPILVLDFDGVCHSYASGWKGADVIPDDHVPGLFEFLEAVAPYFDIQVFSSRSHQPGGIEAMQEWLFEHYYKWLRANCGDDVKTLGMVEVTFPKVKPNAFISIDDRGITFTGEWPSVESLLAFKPWHKKEKK